MSLRFSEEFLRPPRGGLAPTPPVPSTPSWLGAVGEWSTVAGGTLAASGVQQDFGAGAGVFAFSGGCVNSVGVYDGSTFVEGTFLILWGGGHADYSGNEVYAFGPLEDDAPTWRRLRDRTSPAPEDVAEDGSGNPVSRHTYGDIHYLPATNEMIHVAAWARHSDADGVGVAHVFDFDQVSPNVNQPWSSRGSGIAAGQYSAYEPASGRIWFRPNGQNQVAFFNLANNAVSTASFKSAPSGVDSPAAIDTSRGIWMMLVSNAVTGYRTNNGTGNDYYAVSVTGTAPGGGSDETGFLYDPVDDVFRAWPNNGKQLFTLTPPASNPHAGGDDWTWSSATPSGGSTPGAANSTGTFGRFGYVNTGTFRGYVLLNAANQDVFFYRAA